METERYRARYVPQQGKWSLFHLEFDPPLRVPPHHAALYSTPLLPTTQPDGPGPWFDVEVTFEPRGPRVSKQYRKGRNPTVQQCPACGHIGAHGPAVRQAAVPLRRVYPALVEGAEADELVGVIDVGWRCQCGHEWGFELLTDPPKPAQ